MTQTILQVITTLIAAGSAAVAVYIVHLLRIRDDELAALRHHNCSPSGYGVPAPVVDKETPAKIDICGSFVLVQAMPMEKLESFAKAYMGLALRHHHHSTVVKYLLDGEKLPSPEKMKEAIQDKRLNEDLRSFAGKYVMKDKTMNPSNITYRQFMKEVRLPKLLAITYSLYTHNAGEQLAKKLQAVAAAVSGVMKQDLYGLSKS